MIAGVLRSTFAFESEQVAAWAKERVANFKTRRPKSFDEDQAKLPPLDEEL